MCLSRLLNNATLLTCSLAVEFLNRLSVYPRKTENGMYGVLQVNGIGTPSTPSGPFVTSPSDELSDIPVRSCSVSCSPILNIARKSQSSYISVLCPSFCIQPSSEDKRPENGKSHVFRIHAIRTLVLA